MGCCTSQAAAQQPRIPPIQQPQGLLNHPVFRLQAHEKVIDDHAWIGEGVKKTPAFRTTLTQEGLKKWREDFWSKKRRSFQVLAQSMEKGTKIGMQSDQLVRVTRVENAQAIILAQGLIMNSPSLSLIYDQKGKAYFVPMSCINDPLQYYVEEQEDPDGPGQVKSQSLTIRNPKYGDKKLQMMNNQKVSDLKAEYQKQIKDDKCVAIRLFLNGRQLENKRSIFYYKIEASQIVHAFLRYE